MMKKEKIVCIRNQLRIGAVVVRPEGGSLKKQGANSRGFITKPDTVYIRGSLNREITQESERERERVTASDSRSARKSGSCAFKVGRGAVFKA